MLIHIDHVWKGSKLTQLLERCANFSFIILVMATHSCHWLSIVCHWVMDVSILGQAVFRITYRTPALNQSQTHLQFTYVIYLLSFIKLLKDNLLMFYCTTLDNGS